MLKPLRLDIDAIVSSPMPISLSDVKNHLRVDTTDDDTLIESYILAAINAAEHDTHRAITAREHRWTLLDFPQTWRQDILLPRGKTQSVTSIVYTSGKSTTTLTSADWQEDLGGEDGGVLMPKQGESWPSVDLDAVDPVVVTFEAGYNTIPKDIIHAVMLTVGHWYENRESVITGSVAAEVPMSAEALLSAYRMTRWYA